MNEIQHLFGRPSAIVIWMTSHSLRGGSSCLASLLAEKTLAVENLQKELQKARCYAVEMERKYELLERRTSSMKERLLQLKRANALDLTTANTLDHPPAYC